MQHALTSNLSVDVAYVGSHIVHVGIPDSNLNQLTAAQLAQGASLLATTAESILRATAGVELDWRQDGDQRAAAEAVSALPECGHVSQQLRHDELQRA